MCRNPLSPQVPRFCLVEYRLAYLPWFGALEAVATRVSEITYRVSWGIDTARMPEPPKTVEAETRPSNNLRDRDRLLDLFQLASLYSGRMALQAIRGLV